MFLEKRGFCVSQEQCGGHCSEFDFAINELLLAGIVFSHDERNTLESPNSPEL